MEQWGHDKGSVQGRQIWKTPAAFKKLFDLRKEVPSYHGLGVFSKQACSSSRLKHSATYIIKCYFKYNSIMNILRREPVIKKKNLLFAAIFNTYILKKKDFSVFFEKHILPKNKNNIYN